MQLQTKQIELFGRVLLISERTAKEQYLIATYLEAEHSKNDNLLLTALLVNQGLQINIKQLKWYQWIKRYKLKRLISVKNLIDKLPFSVIESIAEEILKLEGVELDKKKMMKAVEKELAEM